ncbi:MULTISPECIES: hypothetical protein [Clavibacter]|uniref:Uncharacterized protein n=1 Tax=Clavibacter tessellarius TaxID=31965 RepID=A0A154V556_9MICO|nr:hypothetical protein [Clavibacter michiganensis]KZC96481.1 hypothetical protein AWH51_02690 [Clavibacter michiganensis subsp. tessellarius]
MVDMGVNEQEIIQGLINSWIPLGLEYAEGAQGVTALFIYAGSEPNHRYANIFFEQDGAVLYPSQVRGARSDDNRVFGMQHCMLDDLREAEARFKEAGIACPTEYRITYEPTLRRLDVQVSHDIKYAHHPVKTLQNGPEDWLDGRLEKVFGKLLPPESRWSRFGKRRG